MAVFTRKEIAEGIERLGQLAVESGIKIELVLVGGALMVLRFGARESTRDVDVAILAPADAQKVRVLARRVAEEHGWPEDWLNDGAKGYLIGLSSGPVVLSAPGIEVRSPGTAQLDRKSTRLNSSHANISYAVFCLKKKKPASPTLS